MEFSGATEFRAAREALWAYLIDPVNLGPCAPVPLQRAGDHRYRVETRVGAGFFSATARLEMEVTELVPGMRALVTWTGGASGATVTGSSTVTLGPGSDPAWTEVRWEVVIQAGGMFADQITRLLNERAADAVDRFVACVRAQVEPPPA